MLSGRFTRLARHPRVALCFMLVVSAVALAGIGRLRFDGSLESLTVPDDPARQLHAETQAIFGDQEIGVVALLDEDVFRPEVLESLRKLTDAVSAIPGVTRALSLANASDPAADVVAPPPLLPRGPISAAAARQVRERVIANPIYVPHLVARDGRALAINLFFAKGRTAQDEERIDHAVASVLAEYDGPGHLYYTGMSHIRVRATEMMRGDLMRFLPLSLAAMMVVLWLSFRSFRAVVLPLVSIAIGVGILLGIMGWVGQPITLATLVLPSLLVVIGGSYAIHVAAVYLDQAPGDAPRMTTTIERVGMPLTASALTTAVGFGSLALHPIPAISGLGIYAVVGILIMAFGTLFGLSLAFSAFPARTPGSSEPASQKESHPQERGTERNELETGAEDPLLERTVVRIADIAVRHRRLLFVVAAGLAVLGISGAMRVNVTTDLVTAFHRDSDVRRAYDAIGERLAGPNPVSIVLTAPEPGYFRSIGALRRLKQFQVSLEALRPVDSTLSLIDYLEMLDLGVQASGGDLVVDEEGRVVEQGAPESFWDSPKEQLPEIFRLVEMTPKTFSSVVDSDFHRVRVTARTAMSGSRDTNELVEEIKSRAREAFPRGVEVDVTGNLAVISSVAGRVLSGQIESVALALGVIFFVLVFLFLSFRVGLAAMIPNVLPILIFFGVMGWTGIELNLATSIIAAVALGIAVDDTIHYMARLNRTVKVTPSHHEALLATMRTVGRPVVATSITLTAGFLVMVLSGFALITAFGWLSAMTMLTALVTNVVLLPAILATVPVVSVWDLVAYRLGPSAHQTIPIFRGLGRLSTRLVVLLGTVRSFAPNEMVMRHGEPGHEMFLVLSGEALVRSGDGGAVMARLARGDVVGEMGLLRQSLRTADVIATNELEVLVIDEAFLRRLQIRYPRFASRIFLNVARILSDRLEEANRRQGLVD